MPHKGRQGPRTLHREVSLDAAMRFHAPRFFWLQIHIAIDFFPVTLDTGWSTDAEFIELGQAYRWQFAWNQLATDWTFELKMGCTGIEPFNFFLMRLDSPGDIGGADWGVKLFTPFHYDANHMPNIDPPIFPPTIFGHRITHVHGIDTRMMRWSEYPP